MSTIPAPNRFNFKLFEAPEVQVQASLESLSVVPALTPLVNIRTQELVDTLDQHNNPDLSVSVEAVGMCNAVTPETAAKIPMFVDTVNGVTMITIVQPVIAACAIAKLLAYLDTFTSKDQIVVLRVTTWLNDDTWLSLSSALSTCKAKTVFCVDFVCNVAAILVLSVVDEVRLGSCSYFVMDSPSDRMAGGTTADMESLVESHKSIEEQVVAFGVKSGMFTEVELKEVYEEKSIFGLFGTALSERITKRVKVV